MQVPRNEFALLLKGSNLVTTDKISLVPSSETCPTNAYDTMDTTHTGSQLLTTAGTISVPGGMSVVGTHLASFAWNTNVCIPSLGVNSIPGYAMSDADCPQVGWYRLCYMKNNGAGTETGVSAYVQQATVTFPAMYISNGAVQSVWDYFDIIVVLRDEFNVPCCFGTKVHLSLTKQGVDHSNYLYNGGGSNLPGNKVVVADVNGMAIFYMYSIRYTAGNNFYLTASVAGHSANMPPFSGGVQGVFTVRPFRLRLGTAIASEYFVQSGLTATLPPAITVRAEDANNNLLVGLSTIDDFHCEVQLQSGAFGTDSNYLSLFGGIGNAATTADLNPLTVQQGGAGRPIFDGGLVVFNDLTVLRQAGRCVPHGISYSSG
jgi:hypothetical protein